MGKEGSARSIVGRLVSCEHHSSASDRFAEHTPAIRAVNCHGSHRIHSHAICASGGPQDNLTGGADRAITCVMHALEQMTSPSHFHRYILMINAFWIFCTGSFTSYFVFGHQISRVDCGYIKTACHMKASIVCKLCIGFCGSLPLSMKLMIILGPQVLQPCFLLDATWAEL